MTIRRSLLGMICVRRSKSSLGTSAVAHASTSSREASLLERFPVTNASIFCAASAAGSDLCAQVIVEGKTFSPDKKNSLTVDWHRNAVFCLFGGIYLGAFQYLYQVFVFRRLFGKAQLERFTSQSWAAKLRDRPGLTSLLHQVVLDLSMLSFVYLPTFYTFKAAVFSTRRTHEAMPSKATFPLDAFRPLAWADEGLKHWLQNFSADAMKMAQFWGPADLVCFSVAIHLRLPLRSVFSFAWTTYLSVIRG